MKESNLAHIEYETLFQFHNDDFEVYKEIINDTEYYSLSIEGYIGFEKLEDAIKLYNNFKNEFYKYLIENKYKKSDKMPIGSFYHIRELAVNYEHNCYWIFTGIRSQLYIWDLYYYIEDVIKQLKTLQMDIELGAIKVKEREEI